MSRLVFVTAIALATGFAGITSDAATFTPNVFNSDAEFVNAFQGNPGKFEAYSAEGRFGNNALNGDWEVGINLGTGSGIDFGVVTDQFVWPNGSSVDFKLTYDGDATKKLTWNVDGVEVMTNSILGDVNELLIRTRSGKDSSLLIDNLAIGPKGGPTQSGGGATAFSSGDGTVNYLRIAGFDFTQDFELIGDATFTWADPNDVKGSRLAFQVKGMQVVPEASTLTMMGLGLSGLGLMAIRRSRRRVIR